MTDPFWKKAIERALRRSTQAKTIGDLELLQPVWGGNGEVLRATLIGAQVSSVIVKKIVPPRVKKKRADPSVTRTIASYDNELGFYRHHADRLAPTTRVARFFFGQRFAEGWLFVLEDLAESGLFPAPPAPSEAQVRAALRWLAGLHARFLGDPADSLWKAGSYWNLAARKDERDKMSDARLKSAAFSLDAALNGATYRTIIHGDAKADNFCFSDDAAVGVDFQHTGLGCGMKDVMCLFDSCFSPIEAAVRAPQLLDDYFAHLRLQLTQTATASDADAIEAEWRALYPVAWADYYRFLDGWAPGKYPPEAYVGEMVDEALESLRHRS